MKELKDYLHLYLGCEVEYKGEIWKLKSVEIGINGNICGRITRKRYDRQTYDLENYEFRDNQIPFKLIPRPLSDITEWIEHSGNLFIPLKVLAGWAGTCSAEDWEVKDNFTVEHKKVTGCTFRITDSGDFIMKRSEKWKDFEVCSQQVFMFQKLLEWHFDIFGLIKSGLAIDKPILKT